MKKVQKAIALVGAGITIMVTGIMVVLLFSEKRWERSKDCYNPEDLFL